MKKPAGVRGPGVPAPAGSRRVELQDLALAWVERTCAEQGLPLKVTDHSALAKVATLLREQWLMKKMTRRLPS
jgi:hypothetical protein